jgi:predicted DCC family thiol-disulfide oxidoreductase YuxK
MGQSPVLLFDGNCHLCSGAVRFILRHERNPELLFASLDSAFASRLRSAYDLKEPFSDSLVLIESGRVLEKSEAALRICHYLKTPWNFSVVFYIIPRLIRDAVYDFIAHNRYKWFGRSETCMVPDSKHGSRFVDM